MKNFLENFIAWLVILTITAIIATAPSFLISLVFDGVIAYIILVICGGVGTGLGIIIGKLILE